MALLRQPPPQPTGGRNSLPRRVGSHREPRFHSRRGRYTKKRRKTVLLLGLVQVILGLVIIGVSFSVFALTSASRIRHASPCWAGFALLFTGGVGVIAWRQPSSLSLGFYTVLSCLCILLHLVATTLAGLGGMELQSVESCRPSSPDEGCLCCTSRVDCTAGTNLLMYSGTTNCHMLQQPMLRDIMFANCMTNIIAIVLCIATSSVGFILALKRRRTQRILSRGYSTGHPGFVNGRGVISQIPTGDAHDQFPPITYLPPPYAPPHYNEISNDPVVMQSEEYREESAAPNVIIDPTELPPPYSTLDYSQRNGRRSRRSRSSNVLENPHFEERNQLSSPPVAPSQISQGCSTQDTPPPPPVRWDSHGLDVRPFILENQTVSETIAMGRGLVAEFPGHESESLPPVTTAARTRSSEGGSNPELSITENPLLPLSEAKTPLQIHMATRCENINMYVPEDHHHPQDEKPKRGGSLTHETSAKTDNTPRLVSDRGRRHSHTGSRTADRQRKEVAAGGKVKRRKSRRTRSLKSGATEVTRRYSSSSDSDEERMRASCPRRKPHKSSSLNSEGSSPKESSDCKLPSTSDQSTLNHRTTRRSKSNSDATTSRDSVFNGFLCPPRLASSERLTLTDNSSLEDRLLALRQSYESLTYSSNQGTLVDTPSLRPTTLDLRSSNIAALGTPSPTSEFSNPWVPRSCSNTSEGVSFASSSMTLASEASGISSEIKQHSSHQDIALLKQDMSTNNTMQKSMLPPLPVGYGQDKTPFILMDNDTIPPKEPLTTEKGRSSPVKERLGNIENNEKNSLLHLRQQSRVSNLNDLSPATDNKSNNNGSSPTRARPKSVVEVNHETRVVLKQLLNDIDEGDVELPIVALLSDIQGMLKSDEHCLVDLQHSANIVNHFMNEKEMRRLSRSLEKLNTSGTKTLAPAKTETAVMKGLQLAKETVL